MKPITVVAAMRYLCRSCELKHPLSGRTAPDDRGGAGLGAEDPLLEHERVEAASRKPVAVCWMVMCSV
jgi:hypothetical protein